MLHTLCVITRHPSISSTFSLSNTWPWGTISLQSHHSRNCVGGCHSICSTFHMMRQQFRFYVVQYIAFVQCAVIMKFRYRTERKSMDMYNTFMSSLCNINNIGNIWCQFGKEWNRDSCTDPAADVTNQHWVLFTKAERTSLHTNPLLIPKETNKIYQFRLKQNQ